MRETREQRIDRILAGGQKRKSVGGRKPHKVKGIGDTLRTLLQERYKATCTQCFVGVIAELNATSVQEVRDNLVPWATAIWENAQVARDVKRQQWATKLLTAHPKVSDSEYRKLVLDACDIAYPRLPLNAIVLDANQHGFGDAMVTAWISEGSKDTDRPLVHYATGGKAELLSLFGQYVVASPVDDMQTTYHPGGREAAGMRITRMQHRSQYLRAGGEPRRPQLTEFSSQANEWAESETSNNTVVLFPHAAHQIRVWPESYWIDLYHRLVDRGYAPVININAPNSVFARLRQWVGVGWERTLAAVKRSRLVITNSSGPAHVCGTMGHPTLVVCGPTKASIAFGHLDSLTCVYEESMPCVQCHYKPPKQKRGCNGGCEALYRLPPETVFERAIELLETEPLREVEDGMWIQNSLDRVEYDDDYFDKYTAFAETSIDHEIKEARVALVRKYECESVLDVGIGCGAFIEECKGNATGFDVMPKAVEWLNDRGLFRSPYAISGNAPDAITCWDSLEHVEFPRDLLRCVQPGKHLFVSLPIFNSLDDVYASKHYRPGEHLTYWTDSGIRSFASREGLVCLDANRMETDLGRESIGTYVFKRPDATAIENTAYVVSGPTSSGNRLVASILVRSGCNGSSSTVQPKTRDELLPASGPFVMIKHANLHKWIQSLRAIGYERVVVVVVVRESVANLQSMANRGHITDVSKAKLQRSQGLALSITDALANNAELEIVTYEGLTEDALKDWLPSIGLPYVSGSLALDGQKAPDVIHDMNAKHYGG